MEKFVSFIILLLAAALLAPGCMAGESTMADGVNVSEVVEAAPVAGLSDATNATEVVAEVAGNETEVTAPPMTNATMLADLNVTTLTAKLDDTILISLNENPTTGFMWNVTNTTGLEIVNDEFVTDKAAEGMVGAGGVHQWMVKAIAAGNQTFDAVYMRSWEPATGEEETYNLKVVVGETAGEPVNETPIENPVAKNSVI